MTRRFQPFFNTSWVLPFVGHLPQRLRAVLSLEVNPEGLGTWSVLRGRPTFGRLTPDAARRTGHDPAPGAGGGWPGEAEGALAEVDGPRTFCADGADVRGDERDEDLVCEKHLIDMIFFLSFDRFNMRISSSLQTKIS